jgi:large subunit ribosomal protein L32
MLLRQILTGLFFFIKIGYTLLTMVNRMRHNRSQRGSTRSHHALKGLALTKCSECNSAIMRHQACTNCGKYRGKTVVELKSKTKSKSSKKVETK